MSNEIVSPSGAAAHQHIKSFVRRAGRIGTGQQRALETIGPKHLVPFQSLHVEWAATFSRQAPTVLEIGFGMGGATAAIAAARPDTNFIGVEVHEPGVGALLRLIDEQALTNLRIVQHDAVEVVRHMVAPQSLAGVHVYFPDPWHKKRHHKRRLVQPKFTRELVTCLARGGYLHCATDWEHYAQQILAVLSTEPGLRNTCEGYAPRPDWRPMTKFEQRGMNLGHGVWDLIFEKRL
jgi:tRNA (guanine-N7-)-methyltransferase